jgi:hypothetical protein
MSEKVESPAAYLKERIAQKTREGAAKRRRAGVDVARGR